MGFKRFLVASVPYVLIVMNILLAVYVGGNAGYRRGLEEGKRAQASADGAFLELCVRQMDDMFDNCLCTWEK